MSRYPVLNVVGLTKRFRVRTGGITRTLTAVEDLSVDIHAGETVALVGESGSGKSTAARCIARLVEPDSGSVIVAGADIRRLDPRRLPRAYKDMQMVFQDPNSSLNPRRSVRAAVTEPLRLHTRLDRAGRRERAEQLVAAVGLGPEHLDRYPHQLSGGQRQRVGIARAIAASPKLLLLDEPTASLDVSVRGQILALLRRLQREQDMAYLLISHDLELVRHVAHRVLVIYLGAIVESGTTEQIFTAPAHPYTRALLSAAPVAEVSARARTRIRLDGEIPSPFDLGPGCRLAGRCPYAIAQCRAVRPALLEVAPGHRKACPVVPHAPTDDGTAVPASLISESGDRP